jgi:hypothetical protein
VTRLRLAFDNRKDDRELKFTVMKKLAEIGTTLVRGKASEEKTVQLVDASGKDARGGVIIIKWEPATRVTFWDCYHWTPGEPGLRLALVSAIDFSSATRSRRYDASCLHHLPQAQ